QTEKPEGGNPIARALEKFTRWFDRQADRYKGVIAWALDHRVAMIGIVTLSFVGAIVIQVMFGGFGFVPNSDRSEINIGLETPPGSNLQYTSMKAEEVARLVRSHPEVAYTYVTVGGGGGASLSAGSVDAGNIYVRLVPKAERDISQNDLGAILREEIRQIGGAKAWVFTSGFGDATK